MFIPVYVYLAYTPFKQSTPAYLFILQGDSGGPLIYKGIAVGITSNGGRKCGSTRKPGLYTLISHYEDWITQTMSQ